MMQEYRVSARTVEVSLLRNAFLASALMALSLQALGETIDLICVRADGSNPGASVRIVVDTDRASVEEIWEHATYHYPMTISPQYIKYSAQGGAGLIETTIDRMAGTMLIKSSGSGTEVRYVCRRGAVKF